MTRSIDREHGLALFSAMVRVRRFEERCAELYGLGKIRGFLHLAIGEEATAVGAMAALREDDNVVATYREHGHALLRGVTMTSVMAEMFGKVTGCSRGRGGSMHLFDVSRRFYGGHAIVGGGLPVAVGLALADTMRAEQRVTACFFGDGAMDEGEFHEAINLAALWRLPVLFLCENNYYAMGTALARHQADVELTHRPQSYGVPAEHVDGMDVIAVERAVRYAADRVRDEGGPRFIELRTYRFRAHSMYDAEKYRDKAEVAEQMKRDPIATFGQALREAGYLDDATLEALESTVRDEVEAAVEAAASAAFEPETSLTRFVHAEVAR